jgi:hypothetical protein
MLYMVGNVLGLMSSDEPVAFDVHLVGIVVAICYYKFQWNFGRWLPDLRGGRRWLRARPKLKLHQPESSYHDLDAEADALLAKVKRDGIDSLTSQERRTLEDYSRRMRQKHR